MPHCTYFTQIRPPPPTPENLRKFCFFCELPQETREKGRKSPSLVNAKNSQNRFSKVCVREGEPTPKDHTQTKTNTESLCRHCRNSLYTLSPVSTSRKILSSLCRLIMFDPPLHDPSHMTPPITMTHCGTHQNPIDREIWKLLPVAHPGQVKLG